MIVKYSDKVQKRFSNLLLKWDREKNDREMPWKGETDPYKIWLSEIILQQTRVEQGLAYYHRFIQAFPDIHQLAQAKDEKVFKLWEGLGYYTRCRNLIHTARQISFERNGQFPETYEDIKTLKGVGPYTAAAIASFAYNLPHAVVDGNVYRVLARVFGVKTLSDSAEGKKQFEQLANNLLDKKYPGKYNQAIMDFGAVVCKPALPLCNTCVFNKLCYAYLNGQVDDLPAKGKKLQIKKRYFYYLVMENAGKVALQQRLSKDIWQHLFEFPMIESSKDISRKSIEDLIAESGFLASNKFRVIDISEMFKQKLSHQLIHARFIRIGLEEKKSLNPLWIWEHKKKLNRFSFPKVIHQYFEKML